MDFKKWFGKDNELKKELKEVFAKYGYVRGEDFFDHSSTKPSSIYFIIHDIIDIISPSTSAQIAFDNHPEFETKLRDILRVNDEKDRIFYMISDLVNLLGRTFQFALGMNVVCPTSRDFEEGLKLIPKNNHYRQIFVDVQNLLRKYDKN